VGFFWGVRGGAWLCCAFSCGVCWFWAVWGFSGWWVVGLGVIWEVVSGRGAGGMVWAHGFLAWVLGLWFGG